MKHKFFFGSIRPLIPSPQTCLMDPNLLKEYFITRPHTHTHTHHDLMCKKNLHFFNNFKCNFVQIKIATKRLCLQLKRCAYLKDKANKEDIQVFDYRFFIHCRSFSSLVSTPESHTGLLTFWQDEESGRLRCPVLSALSLPGFSSDSREIPLDDSRRDVFSDSFLFYFVREKIDTEKI